MSVLPSWKLKKARIALPASNPLKKFARLRTIVIAITGTRIISPPIVGVPTLVLW